MSESTCDGIYGGYQGEGSKKIIPSEAHAMITCRLVPDQDPERIYERIADHVSRHTPPGATVTITKTDTAYPYVTPFHHPAIQLAVKAYEAGVGVPAVFIRSGGSIPIVEVLSRLLHMPIVLMGLGLRTAY
ncbi:peptidase dimerization domain-containing protein, partial [Frankia sp. Cpl3]|nr:peptidase dimerization domain-containing protein [Frankia sp. Cpl3]